MTARFRLDAILSAARTPAGEEISQSQLSRQSGVSFTYSLVVVPNWLSEFRQRLPESKK